MRIRNIIIFTGLTLAITLLACKKIQPDFDVAATDPCDCASEVSADFDIIDVHDNLSSSERIVTDHILQNTFNKNVRFRAKEDNADYTWYIGSEIDTGIQETFRVFENPLWVGSTIPITLVVKKEPNTKCLPDDDGYDSITRTFNIYEQCHEPYLLEGTFRMAPENSTDSMDIVIEFKEYDPFYDCRSADITNYSGNGKTCSGYYFRGGKSYRYFQVGGTPNGDCQNIGGFQAWARLNGPIEMKYEYRKQNANSSSEEIQMQLFGRKL
jgi:hypothetical protein